MRKVLSIIFLCLLLTTNYSLPTVFAASKAATQSGTITTKAVVPGSNIVVSGFTSPFASVVLTADTQFVISTTADAQGNFSVQILVAVGAKALCLDAIDFKRLGSSQACIDIPAHTTIGLFLPPTIGLLSKTVNAGQDATIYGYSLPRSTVIITSKDGKSYTVQTDDTGYYSYTIQSVPAGTFVFSAVGQVLGAQSLPPTGGVELKSLSPLQKAQQQAKKTAQALVTIVTSNLIFILLFLLFLVILVLLFLFWKRRKKKKEGEEQSAMHQNIPPSGPPTIL